MFDIRRVNLSLEKFGEFCQNGSKVGLSILILTDFSMRKKVNNRKSEDIYHVLGKSKSLYDGMFMIYLFSNPFQQIKSKIFDIIKNFCYNGNLCFFRGRGEGGIRGGGGGGVGFFLYHNLSIFLRSLVKNRHNLHGKQVRY